MNRTSEAQYFPQNMWEKQNMTAWFAQIGQELSKRFNHSLHTSNTYCSEVWFQLEYGVKIWDGRFGFPHG